jgi:ribosome-binding protein aMBF1 (putative translation factor)
MDDKYWKDFQNLKPVVLTNHKNKPGISSQSKTNIHLDNKKAIDNEELPQINKYTTEQLTQIKELRNLHNLSQEQLSLMIGGGSLGKDFINRIEANKIQFNQKTFNTIINTLKRIKTNTGVSLS